MELDMMVATLSGFATSGCTLIGQSGSGWKQFAVGGTIWRRIASMEITASSVDVAPRQWPVTGLVELQGTAMTRSPSRVLTACASATSFIFVPVPCALI